MGVVLEVVAEDDMTARPVVVMPVMIRHALAKLLRCFVPLYNSKSVGTKDRQYLPYDDGEIPVMSYLTLPVGLTVTGSRLVIE